MKIFDLGNTGGCTNQLRGMQLLIVPPHPAYVSQKQPAARQVLASPTYSPPKHTLFEFILLITTIMAESYHNIESQIKDALSALERGNMPNLSVTVQQFNVSCSHLHHCFHD